MIDSGTARLGMSVAERLRRNRKMTMTTSAMVSSSVHELSRGLDVDRLVLTEQRARRLVHVGARDRLFDLVDADAARGERAGVDLHADGVLLRAEDRHLGHAADGRDALGQERLR